MWGRGLQSHPARFRPNRESLWGLRIGQTGTAENSRGVVGLGGWPRSASDGDTELALDGLLDGRGGDVACLKH